MNTPAEAHPKFPSAPRMQARVADVTKPDPMKFTPRRFFILLLAAGGIAAWLGMGNERTTSTLRWIIAGIGVVVSLVPAVRRIIWAGLERIRRPSPRASEWTTLLIAVAASAYFVFTAFNQDRDLFPKTHDEGSTAIQIQMLAHGRLWMPEHPLADFFDTFYVITRPVYASLYFPGAAMLNVPAIWLGWPGWAIPVLIAGTIVGLVYRVITELLDGVAGAVAALLMASISEFRMLSMLLFSHAPMLLLGLLIVWAWLRWRKELKLRWAIAIGLFAGWGAITRPVDALCLALPIGAAMLMDLRSAWKSQMSRPSKMKLAAPAIVIAATAPFLAIQLIFNIGVTGHAFQTPYTFYLTRDQPNTSFGFHAYDPTARPASVVPQKQDYYARFMVSYIRNHQPGTFLSVWASKYAPMIADSTLPTRALIPLAAVGLLGLIDRRRVVLFASLPLLVGFYMLNTFFLEHYGVFAAPAVILLVMLGLRQLETAWANWQRGIAVTGTVLIVSLALTGFHEVNRKMDDEPYHSATMNFIHTAMPSNVTTPAVVLFRYATGDPIIEEPVYNFDTPWPDDAPIIRAHDLGARDVEIFHYYAKTQPERTFYLFDRKTRILSSLGSASELAAHPPAGMGGDSKHSSQ